MRVHVFCSDIPPLSGKPASGGGIRSGQIIRLLRARGHEVTFSARRTYLNQGSTDVEVHEHSPQGQIALLQKNRADAAFYCYPISCCLDRSIKEQMKIKVFFDIHGPTYMEEAMWMNGGEIDYFARFAANLSLADEITIVAENQITMVQTALGAIGRGWRPPHIAIVPLELDVEPLEREPATEPLLIFAGGIHPWQDPTRAIETVVKVLKNLGCGNLLLIGGPHGTLHKEGVQITNWLQSMERIYPQFKWAKFMPREQLMQFYARAWAAVELFEVNVERQMAFTTRTWEQLALGVPVLYNNFSFMGSLIAGGDAGWVVDPSDPDTVSKAVEQICTTCDEVVRRGDNAVRLVESYLDTWSGKATFVHL